MPRLTKTIHICVSKYAWDDAWNLDIYYGSEKPEYSDECLYLESRVVTYDLPSDWDPSNMQIAALRAQLVKLRATAEAKATEIEGKIQNLLAISNG
jgi:hypothetical protein